MRELGITSVFFRDPSAENWRSMREAGILNVEICYRDSFRMDEMIRTGDTAYRNAREAGMRPATAHLPFLQPWDISSLNIAERRQAIADQIKLIDHFSELAIPLAVMHPSFEPIDPEERPERLKRSADAIAQIGKHAAGRGVRLAVENLPRTCLGNTSEEILFLTDYGRSCGVCMDVNHLLQESHEHFIHNAGAYMIHMHLSDYDFEDEKHWLPGTGGIDWKQLRTLIDEACYAGNYLVEIREGSAVPGRTTTPGEVAERMKQLAM